MSAWPELPEPPIRRGPVLVLSVGDPELASCPWCTGKLAVFANDALCCWCGARCVEVARRAGRHPRTRFWRFEERIV